MFFFLRISFNNRGNVRTSIELIKKGHNPSIFKDDFLSRTGASVSMSKSWSMITISDGTFNENYYQQKAVNNFCKKLYRRCLKGSLIHLCILCNSTPSQIFPWNLYFEWPDFWTAVLLYIVREFFLTAVWLLHGQLWAIIEGTALLTRC